MTNHPHNNQETVQDGEIQQANIRPNKRISPFWLLPIVALCIGAMLFFQIIKEQGKTIHITFSTGDGLVANKTQIRYQGLQIGIVKKVNFTDDLKKVEVEASIDPEAKTVLRAGTKFWLVQPSASLAGISGLDTLISGNYITLRPGDGDYEDEFVAEDETPVVQTNDGDLVLILEANDLGSISAGASIYYKKMPVGKINNYHFNKETQKVEIQAVIDKNYASLVKKDSHFWNISGFKANVGAGGINVEMDSLNAVVQGAVTFDSPAEGDKAAQNSSFTLYPDLQSAKRGVEVHVMLPNVPGLKAGGTGVFYQNLQVGAITQLEQNEAAAEQLKGTLLLDPSMADLLRSNSRIVLRSPKVNLGDLSQLPNLLRGEYLEIIPGNGDPTLNFTVIKENDLLLQQPNTLVLWLTAPETYGVTEGQDIYFNNIPIGRLVSQQIGVDGVKFKAAIAEQYRYLVHGDSQFIAASSFEMSVGIDGLRFNAASPEKWLAGGVRLVENRNQGEAKESYPLYKDIDNANAGITSSQLTPSLTLTSQNLPNISKGSLVLFRQYEVGQILDVRPNQKNFEIDVGIYPKYRHLLTDHSRFWVESPAQIDITPKGISVQAAPLGRSLKGAISFDNSGAKGNHILYANEMRAKSAGQVITLFAENATNLSKGMSLRYMGLSVGEIESISLGARNNRIVAKALMNPDYMGIVAKSGSQFRVISPQISAGGIENLDSLLQPYIDIDAGSGKFQTEFRLSDNNATQPNKYNNGFPLILETADASNLNVNAPILYRGVEVGKIRKMELNSLGDRVLVYINIANKYSHLVRQNTEFWFSSGYSVELGWSGLDINTGTVQQLLKGGISFSTPTGAVIQPQAAANQRFLLQIKRPSQSRHWNSGALPDEQTQSQEQ